MTRHRPAVLLLSLTALVAAALGLSACGKRENTATGPTSLSRINLVLDYSVNADHVGIFTALKQGDFAQAGLDIGRPQVPSDPSAPLKLLLAGRADLAISYEPEVFLARDKPGVKLVSVAAIVQRPLTSIMSLHGKVTKPADLEGKTVGTAGIPYQSAYLRTIENSAGVDPSSVKEVNVGFNLIPAMVGRNADATLGAFWNIEGVQLKLDRKKPTIIPVDKAGVPTYDELVLVARADYLRDHGPLVRRFIQALKRGTDAAKADPALGVSALRAADPSLKQRTLQAQVAATLPALYPTGTDEPFGWQSPTEWKRFATWMDDHGLLDLPPSPAIITNEFLPGEGVGDSGGPTD